MSEPIKSVEEFIKWTMQLDDQMLLYRGLADADWEVESSAYRRIRESLKEEPAFETFQNYNKQLLDNASLQGFRYQNGRKLSDLELLAELQHYGAATCLIDFTQNPLIALWFACQEEPKIDENKEDKDKEDEDKKNGKVVAIETSDTRAFSTVSFKHLNKPIEYFLDGNKLWKWVPSSLNNHRIGPQQSVFVFREDVIIDLFYYIEQKVHIDAGSKKDIIATLEKSFGVKEQNLFNDLPGFALHNAHYKKYDAYTAEDYFRLGLRFQQQREYEKAKNYYTIALELNPRYAKAFYNRGLAKEALEDQAGAKIDWDKAREIDPDLEPPGS